MATSSLCMCLLHMIWLTCLNIQSTLLTAVCTQCTRPLRRHSLLLLTSLVVVYLYLSCKLQSVCTPVAHTQLMYTPVHNTCGQTPQALASSVTTQQSLDVPAHSHTAYVVTGSDAQSSLLPHVASASTQLPLASADVPVLSTATQIGRAHV